MERTHHRRAADERQPERLLYSREQVGQMLGGISTASVRRLEDEGFLKPIRLSRSPTAMVFFRASDVHQMIEKSAAQEAD